MAKVVINDTNLTDIADAIRKKSGTEDTYKPSEMATAIQKIQTATGLPSPTEDEMVISGDCSYKFCNNSWNWFIEKYGDKIKTKDITNLIYMFEGCTELDEIPFELNCKEGEKVQIQHMFYYCQKLKTLPQINNIILDNNCMMVFSDLYNLREFPEGYFDTWDFSQNTNSMFLWQIVKTCYSLRKFPVELLKYGNDYYIFQQQGYDCICLDEVVDIPIPTALINKPMTSNAFNNFLNGGTRLKDITFKQIDTPVQWKNQTWNLSSNIGYISSYNVQEIYSYNSGITADKLVKDDETYQALKDNPDWFSRSVAYSRYNHDSAVRTINSLPDTSEYLATAGGTNTIKFKGVAGSKTDGGAINTLTEEEIAVATAKGWTVTLV